MAGEFLLARGLLVLALLAPAGLSGGEMRFSSLVGADGAVFPTCAGLDGFGNIYVAGYTSYDGLPRVKPVGQRGSGTDAFLMKLSPDGGTVLGSTYLGGNGDDRAFALSVLPDGTVYVTGWTTSTDFPVVNGYTSSIRGYRDAFLVKIGPGWERLEMSTFFGGSGVESGTAIRADANGAWLAGDTDSSDLPALAAYQGFHKLGTDGFLARFSAEGALVSSTYIGGIGNETVRALGVSPGGEVIVAGGSDSLDLITTGATLQSIPKGGQDGFALRFNRDATVLLSGTFLGGTSGGGPSGVEAIQSIAFDSKGNVLFGGLTPSTDFPLERAWQTAMRGGQMGFVSRFSPDLGTLQWSTFAGGGGRDSIDALAVDAADRVYAAGRTTSVDLPLMDAYQTAFKGVSDGFAMRFGSQPGSPDMSTYLGGAEMDGILMAGVNPSGILVLAGLTGSIDFPLMGGIAQPATKQSRVFVTGFGSANRPPQMTGSSLSASMGLDLTVSLTLEDADGVADIGKATLLVNATFTQVNGCVVEVEPATNTARLWNEVSGTWQTVRLGLQESASNLHCSLDAAGSSIQNVLGKLTAQLALRFNESFAGTKSLWGIVSDASGAFSSWRELGTFAVQSTLSSRPYQGTISTMSGSGSRTIFLMQSSDPNGAADVWAAKLLVSGDGNARGGCQVLYFGSEGTIMLADDSGARWNSAIPGSGTILANSQCLLHTSGSTWQLAGEVSQFRVELEFRPQWPGPKQIHGQFLDRAFQASPWVQYGFAYVAAAPARSPDPWSLSPNNGLGTGATFSLHYEDPLGVDEIRVGLALFGKSLDPAVSCYIAVDRDSGLLFLASEDGTEWVAGPAGANLTLQNSYCALRLAGSSVQGAGLALEVRLDLAFRPFFVGPKEVWTAAVARSGRQLEWRRSGKYYVVRP